MFNSQARNKLPILTIKLRYALIVEDCVGAPHEAKFVQCGPVGASQRNQCPGTLSATRRTGCKGGPLIETGHDHGCRPASKLPRL